MTLVYEYLEDPYLSEGPYLTTHAKAFGGMQAHFLAAVNDNAMQTDIPHKKFGSQQTEMFIVDKKVPTGMQVRFDRYPTGPCVDGGYLEQDYLADPFLTGFNCTTPGMQAQFLQTQPPPARGMQAQIVIADVKKAYGMQARPDHYPTGPCVEGGYSEQDYLTDPYLTGFFCTTPGMQAAIQIIDYNNANGIQSQLNISSMKIPGMQTRITIVDYLKANGFQADFVRIVSIGMQAFPTIYNTTNLRILCDFPSRGVSLTNWSSNSTLAGDFSVQNLDTDIIEQIWRSNNDVVGIQLVCDTGLAQGVFLDTLGILGHNFTKSATVTLLGSNDPTFTTVGVTIPLEARLENMYYIAPELPLAGYRYWRFDIDDPTNTAGFVQIGTIVFGACSVFHIEDIVDSIEFELKDFADTVRTEGFTNVANSRTQKRRIKLDFQSIAANKRNFKIMRDMFVRDRTVSKCLWIPTPSATNQETTARYAAFGKMTQIPTEKHNNKGDQNTYVSFTVDVDESN